MSAIIFDLDGTLVDSAPDIHDAANVMLNEIGQQEIDLNIISKMLMLFSKAAVEGGASIATPISEGILRGALNVLWKNKLAILTISSITIPVVAGGTAAVAAASVLGIEAAKHIGLETGKALAPKIVPVIAGII